MPLKENTKVKSKAPIIVIILISIVIVALAVVLGLDTFGTISLKSTESVKSEIALINSISAEDIEIIETQDFKALNGNDYYCVLFRADNRINALLFERGRIIKSRGNASIGQCDCDQSLSAFVDLKYDYKKNSTSGLVVCFGDSSVKNANMCEISVRDSELKEYTVSVIDEGELPYGPFMYVDSISVDNRVNIANFTYYDENHDAIISESCAGSY